MDGSVVRPAQRTGRLGVALEQITQSWADRQGLTWSGSSAFWQAARCCRGSCAERHPVCVPRP